MGEKHCVVLIIEDGVLKGIYLRDYARKVVLKDKASKDTFVHEIMDTELITTVLIKSMIVWH
jgi:signal-transduction protein with cAMP-binding, CBS, and nucleotidyltransferase domain